MHACRSNCGAAFVGPLFGVVLLWELNCEGARNHSSVRFSTSSIRFSAFRAVSSANFQEMLPGYPTVSSRVVTTGVLPVSFPVLEATENRYTNITVTQIRWGHRPVYHLASRIDARQESGPGSDHYNR